jgi:hypothetical protein
MPRNPAESSPSTVAGAPPELANNQQYQVLRELGRGGMGVVYLARNVLMDRLEVLKVVNKALLDTPQAAERFLREIRSAAQLSHNNVVKAHSALILGDLLVFAMEYVEGDDLAKVVRQEGPLSVPRACYYAHQTALGLQHAYEHGMIHRDIKPHNLILSRQGKKHVVKILDFGLAKASREGKAETGLTGPNMVMGTPDFIAPEQAMDAARADIRADIYSLGCTLYYLLTGTAPFQGNSVLEILQGHLLQEPPPVTQARPDVPPGLAAVVARMLTKDPKQRYQKPLEVAQALAPFLKAAAKSVSGETVPAGGEMVQSTLREQPRATRTARVSQARVTERDSPFARITKRTRITIATVAVVLLAAGVLWWSLSGASSKGDVGPEAGKEEHKGAPVEYYAALTKRRGAPEGVGRFTEAEASHRSSTFRVHRRDGRVVKVEAVNGLGFPSFSDSSKSLIGGLGPEADELRECIFEYSYSEDGRVKEETARDRTGRVVWGLHYTTPTRAYYTDSRGYPRSGRGTLAAHVEFEWRPDGLPRRHLFRDSAGRSVPDSDGVFGHQDDYDERGLPVVSLSLALEGARPNPGRQGPVEKRTRYDKRGDVIEETYFGADGHPALHRDGYSRVTANLDEHGNTTEWAYFGIDGKPTLITYGFATLRARYDDRGNQTANSFHGLDGKPILHKDGYASFKAGFDERGNMTEMAYFGIDGQPTLHKDGYASYKARFDERGNPAETTYYGVDGHLTLCKDGFASSKSLYDERGNVTEVAYYGTDGQLTLHKEGNARVRFRYDDRGNQIEAMYSGLDGQPTLHRDGFAGYKSLYDERGNRIQDAYYGVDGKPALHRDGCSRVDAMFDERGNRILETFSGVDGKITLGKDGYARSTTRYDERGNRTEEAYFGPDGKPILHRDGYAKLTRRFDDRGNRIEEAYFGIDGQPILFGGSYARWKGAYDARSNLIEESFYGGNGLATLCKEGYTRSEAKYDDRGNRIEEAYFGLNGLPALNTSNASAFWKAVYDGRGNQTEVSYFGLDKVCVSKQAMQYDKRGNQIEVAYLEPTGNPKRSAEGYQKMAAKYDDHDRCRERRWEGYDGSDKYVSITEEFDERTNLLTTSYLDAADKLVRSERLGYARFTNRWDKYGQYRLTVVYTDEAGRPVKTRVFLDGVLPGSEAERVGLMAGDLLLTYDGKAIVNVPNLEAIVRARAAAGKPGAVIVTVLRTGKMLRFSLTSGSLNVQMQDRVANDG